jgi:hypothetical protein
MFVNSCENQHDNLDATMSLHINTLRILVSCLLPMAARNAHDSERWLEEIQSLALQSADFASFGPAGFVDSDLMKAAVISSLEEMFSCAANTLRLLHDGRNDAQKSSNG